VKIWDFSIIPRNTTIPTKKSQIFTTAEDNQTAVTVHILQGERPMAHQNRTLGKFDLYGIPPAPRGIPQIEVTFDIDADGILHVSAKDLGTGKEQKIRITASSGLAKEEIDKMVSDADVHASEDRKQKELIEVRNRSDSLIYSVEKTLRDYGDKIPPEDKNDIDKKLNILKSKKDSTDIATITQAMEDLQQAVYKISETVYRDASQAQGSGATQPPPEETPTAEEPKQEGGADYRVVDGDENK
jgi:molecular chaperone DnaK